MDWAKAPQKREQMVLFPTRLDDAVGADHVVRLLDEILARIDWSAWEATLRSDARPAPDSSARRRRRDSLWTAHSHPQHTSAGRGTGRRIDFMWLAEGRQINHTTISKFRVKNAERLKELFVQIGLIAREMGWLTLETLAFDGTRIRANNRRTGTRTPDRLREMKAELATKYAELEQQIADADVCDEEAFGKSSPSQLNKELADAEQRLAKVDAALAEIERMEQAEQKLPGRLPITDPQSRVTPNKDGGYAPNYTPLATVDVDSGLIVSADVIPHTDEDKHLLPAVKDVQNNFQLESPPPRKFWPTA